MDKNKERLLLETLALAGAISSSAGYSLEDMYYFSNEKVMNTSMSLLFEIMDLLDSGHTYETILKAIEELKFEDDEFTKEEQDFLRRDAIKSLNIKYKQKENNYE